MLIVVVPLNNQNKYQTHRYMILFNTPHSKLIIVGFLPRFIFIPCVCERYNLKSAVYYSSYLHDFELCKVPWWGMSLSKSINKTL